MSYPLHNTICNSNSALRNVFVTPFYEQYYLKGYYLGPHELHNCSDINQLPSPLLNVSPHPIALNRGLKIAGFYGVDHWVSSPRFCMYRSKDQIFFFPSIYYTDAAIQNF